MAAILSFEIYSGTEKCETLILGCHKSHAFCTRNGYGDTIDICLPTTSAPKTLLVSTPEHVECLDFLWDVVGLSEIYTDRDSESLVTTIENTNKQTKDN